MRNTSGLEVEPVVEREGVARASHLDIAADAGPQEFLAGDVKTPVMGRVLERKTLLDDGDSKVMAYSDTFRTRFISSNKKGKRKSTFFLEQADKWHHGRRPFIAELGGVIIGAIGVSLLSIPVIIGGLAIFLTPIFLVWNYNRKFGNARDKEIIGNNRK